MNIIAPISVISTASLFINKSLVGKNIVFRVNVNGKKKDFTYKIIDPQSGIMFISIESLPLGRYPYIVYDLTSKATILSGILEIANYETGSILANVDSVAWDDLRAPATGINPIGSPSPATPNTTDGSLTFATSNVCIAWFQLPHAYKEGTDISPHIHWSKQTTNNGTVNWQMKYKWFNIGDVDPGFSSLVSATAYVPNSNTVNKQALSEWADISGVGKTVSSMVCLFLQRTASGDTYTGAANLYEIDIHYQVDSLGSRTEYTK